MKWYGFKAGEAQVVSALAFQEKKWFYRLVFREQVEADLSLESEIFAGRGRTILMKSNNFDFGRTLEMITFLKLIEKLKSIEMRDLFNTIQSCM